MTTFCVPTSVCNFMEALVPRFWWGVKKDSKFLVVKSWKTICQPKDCGGLGFRIFKDFNTAMLAKLGWMMAIGNNSMWSDLLRIKYLKNDSFSDHRVTSGASMVWKVIIS